MHNRKADTIYELLHAQAERVADAVAIVAPGRGALSYHALLGQVDEVARALHGRGVRHTDSVAIVLPNGPEMAVTFLEVAASAVCAPLNPAYSRREFEFYLSDLKAKALIVQSGMNSAAIAVAKERGISIIDLLLNPEAAAGIFDLPDNELSMAADFHFPQTNDIALILYTSGTTSRPKMVPLTHANLIASAGNIAATLRLSEADRCLNVMPLCHIHGSVGALLSSLTAGSSLALPPPYDVSPFWHWLEELQPTWYTAVPTMHQSIIAGTSENADTLQNSKLRFLGSSSAAQPAKLMAGLGELFKEPVIESYGMTQAAQPICSNPLPPAARKAGSVGAAASLEVAILIKRVVRSLAGIEAKLFCAFLMLRRAKRTIPRRTWRLLRQAGFVLATALMTS